MGRDSMSALLAMAAPGAGVQFAQCGKILVESGALK